MIQNNKPIYNKIKMNINSINLAILNQLGDNVNKNIILEEYISILKSSPLLMIEHGIYESFKTKHFKNDIIATNYITDKLKTLEPFKTNDVKKLNESLNRLVKKHKLIIEDSVNEIDENIHNIINESIGGKKDIDLLYESISNVVNIMTESSNITENTIKTGINEYNNKFKLSSEDFNIIKTLSESADDNKKELLESLKQEAIGLINQTNDSSLITVMNETIEKIKSITNDNLNENIISLYELKKELL